jgi:hypothetical protein
MAAGGVQLLAQCSLPLFGQEQELALVLRGTFATEGQICRNPTSADPFSKSLSYPVDDTLGAGAALIYRIAGSNLAFSLAFTL